MKRHQLSYEEHQARHRTKEELGHTMFNIRREAKVPRRELARYLGITDPYLLDMELGNRTFQVKYVDAAITYCADATKRQRNLIKNQGLNGHHRRHA